jgi:hypothetical protein
MARKNVYFDRIHYRQGISKEALDKIVQECMRDKAPMTEEVVALILSNRILMDSQKRIFQKVFHNIGVEVDWQFWFAPDADLIEVTREGVFIGYELKGVTAKKQQYEFPAVYEGLDEALVYLRNPVVIRGEEKTLNASLFDYVYLVHAGSEPDISMCKVIDQCTPIGFILIDYDGVKEIVKPKENPFASKATKQMFLNNLNVLDSYKLGRNILLPKPISPKG